MFNIFEQPWTLSAVAVIVLCAVLLIWRKFPGKRHWWQLVLPVLIGVAAFGFERLVETDYEKISDLIHVGAKAIKQQDCDTIESIISADYRDSSHNSKARLMIYCRVLLSEPLVKKNIVTISSADTSGTTATVKMTMRSFFDPKSFAYQNFNPRMHTKMELNLEKQADGRWLIRRVEVLEINGHSMRWKDIKQL